MNDIEEIRAKVSIEELMGSYVQMKQAGRNFKALCPFHQEKTASFVISPDKGLAYCFGCRKGGDIFACVQELENVEFPEAVRILAEKGGVELKETRKNFVKKEDKDRVLSILETSQKFFQEQLQKNSKAQQYLENRDYSNKEQQLFRLGFAPDSFHELTEVLKKAGYKAKEILDAGIASQKEVGDSNIYDRFRNRVMFPIHNPQGKLVAFGGRTLSKDVNAAKYLNSPETSYYHKGQTLYYFHKAKQSIREQDQAIVCEGYFDALTAHLNGYTQTVASLGTALTEAQLKLVGRFSKNILFAFDADQSGQTAASRSIEIAQRLGYNVSIINIPSGKDPDEALRTAPEEWKKAVNTADKAMDYEFNKAFDKHDQSSIEGKKSIVSHLLTIINRLPNAIEREHYLKKLAFDIGSSLKSLMSEFQKIKPNKYSEQEAPAPEPINNQQSTISNQVPTRAEYLFGLLMNRPKYISDTFSALKPEILATEEEKTLYKKLQDHYNQAEKKENSVSGDEDQPENGRLQLLELYADQKCQAFESEEEISEEVEKVSQQLQKDYKRRRLQELRFQMGKESSPETLQEYQTLLSKEF
jgi:DNA primase